MGFDKCVGSCIHHYSIIQYSWVAPKNLFHFTDTAPLQIFTCHWPVHCLSFVFVITLYKRNYTVCRLWDWFLSLTNTDQQLRISPVLKWVDTSFFFFKSLNCILSYGYIRACLSISLLKNISSLLPVSWRLPWVLCHVGYCIGQLTYSKPTVSKSMDRIESIEKVIWQEGSYSCM